MLFYSGLGSQLTDAALNECRSSKDDTTPMKLIINLILLPFVIVFFLLKGINQLFRPSYSKDIPRLIEKLAADHEPFGTAVIELTFDQVLIYANQQGVMLSNRQDSFEFELMIGAKSYNTVITRAPDGSNCAIFRCRPIASNSIQPTLNVNINRQNFPRRMDEQPTGAEEKSSTEIAEVEGVIKGLNTIFDKHAEIKKW